MKLCVRWLVIAMLVLLAAPGTASAQTIFEHQHTTIAKDQTVDDVYVVGGDADIDGHVTGIVTVVNGNVHLGGSAVVEGLVLVIGGKVEQEAGARLGDDIYSVSFDGQTRNSLLIGGGMVAGVWAVQLAAALLIVIVPVLAQIIGRRRTAELVSRFPPAAFGGLLLTGLYAGLLVCAISVLLIVTIIGIPLLLVVALLLLAAMTVGLTALSFRAGELFRPALHQADWVKTAAGAAVIAAVVNIPVIGWLALLLILLLSCGMSVQLLAGFRKRKTRAS